MKVYEEGILTSFSHMTSENLEYALGLLLLCTYTFEYQWEEHKT